MISESDTCLLCPYCDRIFEEPLCLPCGHNVCKKCVAKLIHTAATSSAMKAEFSDSFVVENIVKCPVCGHQHNVIDFDATRHLFRVDK